MDLFSPIFLGDLHLANRVVMAPLTRVRSGADGVPTAPSSMTDAGMMDAGPMLAP